MSLSLSWSNVIMTIDCNVHCNLLKSTEQIYTVLIEYYEATITINQIKSSIYCIPRIDMCRFNKDVFVSVGVISRAIERIILFLAASVDRVNTICTV